MTPRPAASPSSRAIGRRARTAFLVASMGILLLLGCSKQLIINDGADYTNNRDVTLKLEYRSADYATYKLTTRENGDYWSADVEMKIDRPGVTMPYRLRTAGDGSKRIEGKGRKRILFGWTSESSLDPDTIILDTVPPGGGFTVNGGAATTNDRNVTLALAATDATSGVAAYQATETIAFPDAERPYAGSVGFTTSAPPGEKTLFVRYRDRAGNWSGWIERRIVLDRAAPTVTLVSPANNATVSIRRPEFAWSAMDNPASGAAGLHPLPFRILISNAFETYLDSGWTAANPFVPPANMPYGTYTWSVQARDAAGNAATSAVWTVTIADTSAPAPLDLAILSPIGLSGITHSPFVTVRCVATDATAVDAVFLSLRPAPAPARTQAAVPGESSGWLPFTTPGVPDGGVLRHTQAFPFALPTGDGHKRIYAWFRDPFPANPISGRIAADATLDGTPPLAGGVEPVATVETLAGRGLQGETNGTGSSARFMNPQGMCFLDGGTLIVADYQSGNAWVRKLTDLQPNAAVVTNLCRVWSATDSAYVPENFCVYSGDEVCRILLRYNTRTGVSTRLENAPAAAYPSAPWGVYHDAAAARLLVAAEDNKLYAASLAGAYSVLSNGPFNKPRGICRDDFGSIFVADSGNHRIARLPATGGTALAFAGGVSGTQDGVGASARFNTPAGVAADRWGNLYVADRENNRIRRLLPSGETRTIAGSASGFADGDGTTARFRKPHGILVDPAGILYVSDRENYRIRRILYDSPQGLAVNGGATLVHARRVALDLSAADAGGEVTGFRVAESAARPAQPAPAVPVAPPALLAPDVWYEMPAGAAADLARDFELGAGDGLKTLWVWYRDRAGNVSPPVSRTVQLDTIPPLELVAGSLDLKRQDGTLNPASIAAVAGLRFLLSARSRLPTMNITHWMVTEGDAPPGAGDPRWVALASPAPEIAALEVTVPDLTTTQGNKSYFAWFMDMTGAVSPLPLTTYRRDTLLDSEPPSITQFSIHESNGGVWSATDGWTNRPEVRLRFDARDLGLGVSAWCAKIDPAAPPPDPPAADDPAWRTLPAPQPVVSISEPYVLSRVNEEKRIWLFVRDVGGNVSPPRFATVSLDTVAPLSGTRVGEVTTVAGDGLPGEDEGPGATAGFRNPDGIALDRDGAYVAADRRNHRIRRIARDGFTSFLAGGSQGTLDGAGAAAQFNEPTGISVDRDGSYVITDPYNHRIRRVTPAGVATTVAGSSGGYRDGTGDAAQFDSPSGSLIDRDGTYVVVEHLGHRVRRVTPAGVVTTVAGSDQGYADGAGAAAKFNQPRSIALDRDGTYVLAENGGRRVRRVTPDGRVTTIAGSGASGDEDGVGAAARFRGLSGIAVAPGGAYLVTDHVAHRVRRVTPTGVVTTLAGGEGGFADGTGELARFDTPTVITADRDGSFLISDFTNHRIRRLRVGQSGDGIARIEGGIRLTSAEEHSGIAGFYLSFASTPPRHDAPQAGAFTGAAELDRWITVDDHAASHHPYTKDLPFTPEETLHGWFRDRAGNVSAMAVLRKRESAGGMRAVAQLGGTGTLRAPRHVAVAADGALLVVDHNLSAVSPVHRFMNESDATGARVGFAGVERDRMARDVAGLAALAGGAFALAERGKHRVAIYDDRARLLDVVARRIDLAANHHGIGALEELQAKLLDRYASAADHARADARIFPTQNSAEPARGLRVTTLEVFVGDSFAERLTGTVRVNARRTVSLQARAAGPRGDGAIRSILVAARSSADPRGVPVQLVETGTGTNLFRGRLELDILPGAEQGRLVIAEGAGQLWFAVAGESAARVSFPTFRPRPFKTTPGTYAGEENPLDLGDGVSMTFVWIPPGSFMMGAPTSDPDALLNEKPQHQVTITKGFWMGEVECDVALWKAVMGTKGIQVDVSGVERLLISYDDVVGSNGFMQSLHALHPSLGIFRLPTEAEWEYAYRAGSQQRFPWGDALDDRYCKYDGVAGARRSSPNAWNLHDMADGLGEFCADFFASYPASPLVDPTGPSSGPIIVLRGMYVTNATDALNRFRASARWHTTKTAKPGKLSFRPVLQVEP